MTSIDLSGFIAALSAPTGAPGGGAASGVSGTLGCALFEMVAGVTLTLPRFTEGRDRLEEARKQAGFLGKSLLELSHEDAEAYKQVESAMKMPRATSDEKAARRAAMQDAFKLATKIPLETVKTAVSALALLPDLLTYGNPNAITDIAVGGLLLDAARRGAAMNAEINISSIKDAEFAAAAQEELARLSEEAASYIELLAEAARKAELTW